MRWKAFLAVAFLGLTGSQVSRSSSLLVGYSPECRPRSPTFPIYECSGWGVAAFDEATGQRLPDVIAPQSGEFEGTDVVVNDRCDLQAADQIFQGETGDYVGLFRPYGKDHVDNAWFYSPMMSRPSEILLDDFNSLHIFSQQTGELIQTIDKASLGLPSLGPPNYSESAQLLEDKIYLSADFQNFGVNTGYEVKRLDGATRAVDPSFHLQSSVFVDPQHQQLSLVRLGVNSAGELVAWEQLTGAGGYSYQLERFDPHTGLFLGTVRTGIAPSTTQNAGASFFGGLFYAGWSILQTGSAQIHRYSAESGLEVQPAWEFGEAGYVSPPLARRDCTPDNRALRLQQGRFEVTASFRTPAGQTGDARAVGPRSNDSGQMWFFDKSNAELVVKVLDGCASSGNYWVFLAGLTNLQVEVTVTDTTTGNHRTYSNPQGQPFVPVQDTAAFAACP
ncbi:MAG: hypothetical protein ACM3OB_00150 [Acidobacteriota bacterium]